MPLPRMTTRRWMVAAAVAGLALGVSIEGVRLYLRSTEYRKRREFNAGWERTLRSLAARPSADDVPALLKGAEYHARLKREYDRAARYPWLHVPPDPPSPAWPEQPD